MGCQMVITVTSHGCHQRLSHLSTACHSDSFVVVRVVRVVILTTMTMISVISWELSELSLWQFLTTAGCQNCHIDNYWQLSGCQNCQYDNHDNQPLNYMVPSLGCHSDNFLVVPDDNLDNFLDDNHKVVTVTIRLTTFWQLFVLLWSFLDCTESKGIAKIVIHYRWNSYSIILSVQYTKSDSCRLQVCSFWKCSPRERNNSQWTWWIQFLHSQKKGYRNSTPVVLLLQIVPLCRWGAKTVPLGEPNYGQPNSSPRGADSAPFFLSVIFYFTYWLSTKEGYVFCITYWDR